MLAVAFPRHLENPVGNHPFLPANQPDLPSEGYAQCLVSRHDPELDQDPPEKGSPRISLELDTTSVATNVALRRLTYSLQSRVD